MYEAISKVSRFFFKRKLSMPIRKLVQDVFLPDTVKKCGTFIKLYRYIGKRGFLAQVEQAECRQFPCLLVDDVVQTDIEQIADGSQVEQVFAHFGNDDIAAMFA